MSAQGIAQTYWLAMMAQPLSTFSVLSDLSSIVQQFGPDELDDANAAIEQYYSDSGLAVDIDTLADEFESLRSSNLAFWAGLYYMPHPVAGTLQLNILAGTVTLSSRDVPKATYFSVPYASVSFANQTLSYEDATVQFSAKLWYPSDLAENAAVPPAVMAARNEARLTGTLSVKAPNPEGPYALEGKRGVYTAAGLMDPGYGDPAPVWAGQYQTRYVDGDFSFLGTVALSVNADGSMGLAMGHQQATAVAFSNSTLAASLPAGAVIALRLLCAPSGVRSFTGAVEAGGITRRIMGSCATLYAPASRQRTRAPTDAAPGFCDTHVDQVLTLAQLGEPLEPLGGLKPVPVLYADGSPGTIVVTPTRAADVYRVPPGAMVAYRPPATAQSDDELQVAWQLDEGYALLKMIEPAYYQLRVSLSDAESADHKGIDITLALDAPSQPGFLSLLAPSTPTCGAGTGGAHSPVKDFTIASVLLANAKSMDGDGVLKYQFALSGKSTSLDNAAGDHDGFLCATLTYNAADGSEKHPPRLVRVPMLCAVTLPVALTTPLSIEGMAALPGGYPNRPYSGTLSATGGLQPIVWTSTSPAPDGLSWAASDESLNFTLSGTLGALPTGQTVPVSISAQSDPSTAVSSLKTAQGNLLVSDPPAEPTDYARIGWIAGGTIASGLLSAFVVWRIVKRANEKKVDADQKDETKGLLEKQNDLANVLGDPTKNVAAVMEEQIHKSPQNDVANLGKKISEENAGMAELQSRMDKLRKQIEEASNNEDSGREVQLIDEWLSLAEEQDKLRSETKDLVAQRDASQHALSAE